MMNWQFANADRSITLNVQEDSATSEVWGVLTFNGAAYRVNGAWQAPVMAPRVNTNICLRGSAEISPNIMSFVTLSGLMTGSGGNMASMNVAFCEVSNASGAFVFNYQTLTPATLGAPPPVIVSTPVPPANIPWNLKSLDGSAAFDGAVSVSGGVAGVMTVNGTPYQMIGGWSSSAPGRAIASCLGATGTFLPMPPSPSNDYLSACGIVINDQTNAQGLIIQGNIAPTTAGQNTPVSATLLPTMNTDSAALNAAYAESYMVIQIGGKDGGDDNAAVAGWMGPGAGLIAPFGAGGNYQSTGVAMSQSALDKIVKPGSPNSHADYNIVVPNFASGAAMSRPVMIQFLGDDHHFSDPPLMEYHQKISKIFYDSTVGALVLQYLDPAGRSQATNSINFNEGRKKTHRTVIIEN